MTRSQSETRAQRETKSGNLSGSLVTVLDPAGAASEAYRTLRTNLLYAPVDDTPSKVIVVTSPDYSAKGKSTVCANLGVVLAQVGKNTLIVDCDFRRPVMHEIFGLRSTQGMTDILVGGHSLQEAYQEPLPDSCLKVLAAGTPPPNPAELLGSRRFSEFLASVREEFDYVLIDSPPTGPVSDPAVLATQGDGVLLTLDAKKTRKEDVLRAVRSLTAVGANVLGTVMSNAKKQRRRNKFARTTGS
jgi:capsular exopolysaccharide synthesis family protein